MTKSLEIIENALLALRKGKLVILTDDESNGISGHFVLAAAKTTLESLNLITTHGRGFNYLAMEASHIEALGLPLMTAANISYTISIDAKEGIGSGSSVQDRVRTIQVAIESGSNGSGLRTPGHVFPVKAKQGGVLKHPGYAEGAVDLARLSGLNPSSVISEILKEDGSMARLEDLEKLKTKLNIPMVSIQDLIHYRLYYEKTVHTLSTEAFISQLGSFVMHTFENSITKKRQTALVKGKPKNECLVRLHEGCQASESFAFTGCDCTSKLAFSLSAIEESGNGMLMYFKDEKMDMRHCVENSSDAIQKTSFHIADAAQILKSLDIVAIRLMTNDLKKVEELSKYGIQVVERVPIPFSMNTRILKSLESLKTPSFEFSFS